jgi:hypothetical protein
MECYLGGSYTHFLWTRKPEIPLLTVVNLSLHTFSCYSDDDDDDDT